MKKAIFTIIALVFVSSMLVNTAYAAHGYGHGAHFNPLWLPLAILSTVVATVATIGQPHVSYEQRGYYEPRQRVIYDEPQYYRQDRYNERDPANYYYGERGRTYETPPYRQCR